MEWHGAFLILSQRSSVLLINILEQAFNCDPGVLIIWVTMGAKENWHPERLPGGDGCSICNSSQAHHFIFPKRNKGNSGFILCIDKLFHICKSLSAS